MIEPNHFLFRPLKWQMSSARNVKRPTSCAWRQPWACWAMEVASFAWVFPLVKVLLSGKLTCCTGRTMVLKKENDRTKWMFKRYLFFCLPESNPPFGNDFVFPADKKKQSKFDQADIHFTNGNANKALVLVNKARPVRPRTWFSHCFAAKDEQIQSFWPISNKSGHQFGGKRKIFIFN